MRRKHIKYQQLCMPVNVTVFAAVHIWTSLTIYWVDYLHFPNKTIFSIYVMM